MRTAMTKLDRFFNAYVECALWSSTDNSDDNGGTPLDENYSLEDIAPDTLEEMKGDCECFLSDNSDDIGTEYERAGHDFWLTRNRHGAGFFDGDWPDDVGERLTRAAHAWGSFTLYVGDNGRIDGG